MDPMEEIRQMFFVECEEHLETLQEGIGLLSEVPDDSETIGNIFRAVHSIKGGAAAFGLETLVSFAHEFESMLDAIRSQRLAASPRVLAALMGSADILSDLVAAGRDGGTVGPGRIEVQVGTLASFLGNERALEDAVPVDTCMAEYRVGFRPHAALYERGNEPLLILRQLAAAGEARVHCDVSALPGLDDINATQSYLCWSVEIATEATEADLREVFDFVEGDCDVTVERLRADPEPGAGAHLEQNAVSQPPQTAPAANADTPRTAETGSANSTIRVDLDRVDRLINLVGELVINQAMLSQSVAQSGLARSSAIAVGLDEFKQLTLEVQESVLAIRAQPVKPLFQRMSRIVREAAAATGKRVRLSTAGEMTEVDKTLVERLTEPLTHMIRNAVDHGLEKPADRIRAGKPEEGELRLTAEHRSGRVVIEIADDGAGINRKRVRQVAAGRGLIAADAVLSDSEIDNLLFLPGFSTAAAVSDLSGRGVGMDVVKRSINGLGGRITILSQPGQGTCFSISLPLTLAILDGMIVGVGGQTMVMPLSAIQEVLKPDAAQVHALGRCETVVQVRGRFVPIIDVGYLLGFSERSESYADRVMLLIETGDGGRRALVIDAIQEQRQVVIKGLEENYGRVSGIAAATILGDGRIALILDPEAIVSDAALRSASADSSLALAG